MTLARTTARLPVVEMASEQALKSATMATWTTPTTAQIRACSMSVGTPSSTVRFPDKKTVTMATQAMETIASTPAYSTHAVTVSSI